MKLQVNEKDKVKLYGDKVKLYGKIGFIICWIVLVVVLLYNTLPSRKQMIERHRSSIKFIEAKANYFNARADSLSYLKTCTPESDAMMDIAESISTTSANSTFFDRGVTIGSFRCSSKSQSSNCNCSKDK